MGRTLASRCMQSARAGAPMGSCASSASSRPMSELQCQLESIQDGVRVRSAQRSMWGRLCQHTEHCCDDFLCISWKATHASRADAAEAPGSASTEGRQLQSAEVSLRARYPLEGSARVAY